MNKRLKKRIKHVLQSKICSHGNRRCEDCETEKLRLKAAVKEEIRQRGLEHSCRVEYQGLVYRICALFDRPGVGGSITSTDEVIDKIKKVLEKNRALTRDNTHLKDSAGFCKKHPPGPGTRNCLVCACIEMGSVLSRIDYMVGEPNDHLISIYDAEQDPEKVLERVKEVFQCDCGRLKTGLCGVYDNDE